LFKKTTVSEKNTWKKGQGKDKKSPASGGAQGKRSKLKKTHGANVGQPENPRKIHHEGGETSALETCRKSKKKEKEGEAKWSTVKQKKQIGGVKRETDVFSKERELRIKNGRRPRVCTEGKRQKGTDEEEKGGVQSHGRGGGKNQEVDLH